VVAVSLKKKEMVQQAYLGEMKREAAATA